MKLLLIHCQLGLLITLTNLGSLIFAASILLAQETPSFAVIIPLETAIHKLTALPAKNLGIRDRGQLSPDYHADGVVFDPAKIEDHATFELPHQYSTGMRDVLVNGEVVLRDGQHTGAKPGQVVYGPGKFASTRNAK